MINYTDVLVSVVIPTVGRSSLGKAIASVEAQGVATEVIVVLDAPDEAEAVGRVLSGGNVRLLVTAGKIGGGAARDLGTQAASGDFIAYLDDDDAWLPGKLIDQVAALKANPHGRLCVGLVDFVSSSGAVRTMPSRWPAESESVASYAVVRESLRFGDTCIQTSTFLLAAELAKSIGWRTIPKHQDWDFAIRATENDSRRLVWVSRSLVEVKQGSSGSVSRSAAWKSSLVWYHQHRRALSARARGDFIWAHVFRAALASRSPKGMLAAALMVPQGWPNWAAVIVGLSGVRGF